MAHYELLLFDADATLFDFYQSSQNAFRNTMEFLGVPFTLELYKRYSEIDQEIWLQLEQQKQAGEQIVKRFQILFSEQGVDLDPQQANAYYLDNLGRQSHLVSGAKELLEKLHAKHRIAIITNGNGKTQHSRVENSALAPYIENVFVSDEIGFFKPDTRFFDHVFSKLSPMNRRRSLIIGDSLTADIKGGEDSGVHTCWYNPLESSNYTTITPTYEIAALQELETIV